MDGMTVETCLNKLRLKSGSAAQEDQHFSLQFFEALLNLTVQLGDPFIQQAKLTARVLVAPCLQEVPGPRLEYASIIALRVVTDVHSKGNIDPRFGYVPASFFLTQQRLYRGSSYNDRFAKMVHAEFGEKVSRADQEAQSIMSRQSSFAGPSSSQRVSRSKHFPRITPTRHWPFRVRNKNISDCSSQKRLVNVTSSTGFADLAADGAQATREISIEVNEVHQANSPDTEMTEMRGYGQPMTNLEEKEHIC